MTKLQLYNAALGMIAHDRTIAALSGSSTEELRCETYYDAARRSLFALYDWKWLSTSASLTDSAAAVNGLFSHTIASLIRVLTVKNAAGLPLGWEVTHGILKTDSATVVVSYIADDADPANWPALIVDAVTAELAARICVPMTGNQQRSTELHNQALGKLSSAAGQSGDQPAPGTQPAAPSGSYGAGYRAAMRELQGG